MKATRHADRPSGSVARLTDTVRFVRAVASWPEGARAGAMAWLLVLRLSEFVCEGMRAGRTWAIEDFWAEELGSIRFKGLVAARRDLALLSSYEDLLRTGAAEKRVEVFAELCALGVHGRRARVSRGDVRRVITEWVGEVLEDEGGGAWDVSASHASLPVKL